MALLNLEVMIKHFANTIYHDVDEMKASEFLSKIVAQYNEADGLQYMKFNKAQKAQENMEICRQQLTLLKTNGYVKMYQNDRGEYMVEGTQLLYDLDDYPIGFKKKIARCNEEPIEVFVEIEELILSVRENSLDLNKITNNSKK